MTPANPAFSVVVPNWNGERYLRRGLGSLFLTARATGADYEVVVVDDASQDAGADLIAREFPQARLIRKEKNSGFAETANLGVREARGDIVILANNDLIVREEFAPKLLAAMKDPNVFGAGAQTLDWDAGEPNHVEMFAVWRDGLLAEDFNRATALRDTVFMQAGACALRRDRFLELGGFSPLYAPGYWEDYDLSYRARKRGWRVLYEPDAIAFHLGKASLAGRYGKDGVEILRRRNQILFTWANLSDAGLWARHLAEFPAAVARDLARPRGNAALAKGFARAVGKIGAVARERARRKSAGNGHAAGGEEKLSDSKLLGERNNHREKR